MVAAILFSVIVLAIRFVVLPNIQKYQGDIISRVSVMSGMDVSAGAIRGGWAGLRPYVEMENVVFLEPASSRSALRPAGSAALKLPKVVAGLSWWSLLVGQIRFAEVVLDGPELALNRNKDGLIYFAGRALNQPKSVDDDAQLLSFLLEQSGLVINNATLTWDDALALSRAGGIGNVLRFTEVGLRIQKNGDKHQIGFTANPPVKLAKKVAAQGDLMLDFVNGRWLVKGTLYVAATDASVTEFRQHAPVSEVLQTGSGNLRIWIEIDNTLAPAISTASSIANAASSFTAIPTAVPITVPTTMPVSVPPLTAAFNPIRAISADVYLTNVRAQFDADLAPLNIAKLAGRIEYQAQDGGFTGGGKALEIRTREGVVLPPADFSLTLQNQTAASTAKGELSGNNIDLKVMFALMEYFPVGKELRNFVARYQPRGELKNTSIAWSGLPEKLDRYRIKGTLHNFGINTDGKAPGVDGFSGTVDGDDKGGKFNISSKMMAFEAPQIFRAPLKFDSFDSSGKWRVSNDLIEIEFGNVGFANADLAGEFSGLYSRFRAGGTRAVEEKGPGSLDIKGNFSRVKALAVGHYLPNGITQTRGYLEHALKAGEMSTANFQLKGEIFEFPFRNGKGGNFTARAEIKKVDFRYNDDWPMVSELNGEMSFDNTKFGIAIDSAKILNTKINHANVDIADLGDRAAAIAIKLVANAKAEEVSRFLRESPLAGTVGGFTKVLAVDGLGKLDLALNIPLVPVKDGIKVNGKYALLRVTAKPTLGPVISNLTGIINFTERSVQSSSLAGSAANIGGSVAANNVVLNPRDALQGLAYGFPAAITVSGAGEAGINTEFTVRAEMSQLANVLPFRLPQQITGTTDFHGKILTKNNATKILLDSNLAGVTSMLPYPMAKADAEIRPLRVQFVNTALPAERIRVTLAGNATANADDPETRVDARFQRRFDDAGVPVSLLGGVATVGAAAIAEVAAVEGTIPEGVWFAGRLKLLDFDLWRAASQGFYPATDKSAPPAKVEKNDSPIVGFDFKLGGLLAYGRQFGTMNLKGRHGVDDWRLVVDSTEAAGDFTWRPGAFNDRGSVRARLKNFVLVDEAANLDLITKDVGAIQEADFPALDIVAEQFTLKDRWMGKLELRASPQGPNWKIDQLIISNGHVKLEMDGMWLRYGEPELTSQGAGAPVNYKNTRSKTTMNVKLDSTNLNALLAQFGFGEQLRGGSGNLEGKLSWPGHTYQMQLTNLSGNFKMAARNGQFAKIEPGAGKLLGLISLQSLPRRFTLDFRDIFSQGFAFNNIDGDVSVKDGIMFTENFSVTGPAAEVKMAGDVSLSTERVHLTMTVIPRLDESVAVGAGLATLNPVVALAVYLGQKVLQNPVEKIFSYRYVVSGTWDNPQVDKIDRNGVIIPAAESAVPLTKTPTTAPSTTALPTPTPKK